MGVLVYVLGRSGSGKSFSMRKFDKKEVGVVNVQGKILPFKGSGSWDIENTDEAKDIVDAIKRMSKKYKAIVVDDFQYVMANEFMRRAAERGYDKFTEIARHAWDIANVVRELPSDVIVYIMCHTDTDQDGFEKLKTIGKLLDEKIVLEGMSTIVLKTAVSDGQYMFLTQNNGKDTVKSPAGMFPSYAIDNDLKYVDEKIRNYYELGEFLTDEEMAEIDEAAKKDDIPIKEEKKKRGRNRGKEEEEKPAETSPEEEKEEAPKRSRRRKAIDEDLAEEREEVEKRNAEKIEEHAKAEQEAIEEAAGDREELPWDEVEEATKDIPMPEPEELPRRKRREKTEEAPAEEPAEEAAPARRRRRRS